VVVLQPGYLPWLGFFDQMQRASVFVYYDDVQFDKGGWRNRNRIKTDRGAQWLTVPVLQKGRALQRICDVEIDNRGDWARKHVATISQAYAHAPYRDVYLSELEALLSSPWTSLLELDLAVAAMMARWLSIVTPTYRSSELGIAGDQSGRLLAICRHFGADRYLSGLAAKAYLDEALFMRAGIAVEWQDYRHPAYPQLHGPFLPYLSALDLIFNVGPESGEILRASADWA
jgi:hypothetical protein